MEGSGGYTKECKVRTTTSNPLPDLIHFVFSSSRTLPLVLLPRRYLHNHVSRTPLFLPFHIVPSVCWRLQRIIIQGDIAHRLPLIVSRCFTTHCRGRDGYPGAFLPRSTHWSARTTPGSVISFCARESKARGKGMRQKATIYEWSPRW